MSEAKIMTPRELLRGVGYDFDAIAGEFARAGKSLYDRGYATGAAGNMSVLLPDGRVLATPTGSCMGALDPEKLSVTDLEGRQLAGDRATKEVGFHLALYRNNPEIGAVVHLHSRFCTALSCLNNLNRDSVFGRAFTPYALMRMKDVPLVDYFRPGSPRIAEELARLAPGHNAFLLANHGPVACGRDLTEAVNNAEEMEATASVFFLLHGCELGSDRVRYLTEEECAELKGK